MPRPISKRRSAVGVGAAPDGRDHSQHAHQRGPVSREVEPEVEAQGHNESAANELALLQRAVEEP